MTLLEDRSNDHDWSWFGHVMIPEENPENTDSLS